MFNGKLLRWCQLVAANDGPEPWSLAYVRNLRVKLPAKRTLQASLADLRAAAANCPTFPNQRRRHAAFLVGERHINGSSASQRLSKI
jgi:hypothetical protein